MSGKPGEKGSLEYWWAGPEGSRLQVTSPSLGTVNSLRMTALPSNTSRRSIYLVGELLSDFQNPGSVLGLPGNPIGNEERVSGTTILECMHPVLPPRSLPSAAVEVCTDSISGTIRLIASQGHRTVRNRTATFAGTHVALDTSIFWSNVQAITGHIDELQSFDPLQAGVTLEKPAAAEASQPGPSSVRLPAAVIAGAKIGGSAPVYPVNARMGGIQGTVILVGEISPTGHISYLVPLASPDPLLTDSAIEAVSNWTYRPYLLDGSPVSVTTTITVNYALNHS